MSISSTNRKAGPYIGNGTASVFSFAFKVFSAADVEVVKLDVSTTIETILALTTDYTVALNQDQNANPGGSVTLVAGALATGFNLVITSDIANLQPTDLTNQGGFYPDVINTALDRATIQIQQLQESVDRAALLPITSAADAAALVADITRLASSADNLDIDATNIGAINTVAGSISNVNSVAGNATNINAVAANNTNITSVAGNSTNINSVAGNATNINTVAGNISDVIIVSGISAEVIGVAGNETNINDVNSNAANITTCAINIASIIDAPTQATNAANSAAQAAASAAAGMYSAVQDKSANYTIVAGDAGDLIRVTTTSGGITITLPTISTVTDGFKIAVVKWTADSNQVTVVRSGSDTINGASSSAIGSQYSQIIFVADAETSTWFASQSGLGATNVNIQNFSGNGSTVNFTLSSDPSTENNTDVYISGVYQQKNTYSVSGTTLSFSTAPPAGTNNIEVVYVTPLPIGTPSDGTVTREKLSVTGTPDGTRFLRDDMSWQEAGFAAGTKLLFAQTAAPTGWTKDTTHDNKALRVVSGTASSGGTVDFTTAFASQTPAGTVGSTTLAESQIPSHTHLAGGGGVSAASKTGNTYRTTAASGVATSATGGSGSHNHTFSGTAINLAVQYVDVIIATKN